MPTKGREIFRGRKGLVFWVSPTHMKRKQERKTPKKPINSWFSHDHYVTRLWYSNFLFHDQAQNLPLFATNSLLYISIQILLTVLSTYPKVLTRRMCLTIGSFLNWWSFPLFSWPLHLIQGWCCKEKLEANPTKMLRGLRKVIQSRQLNYTY